MKRMVLAALLAAMLTASCADHEPVNLLTAQAIPGRMNMLRPYMTTSEALDTLGAGSAWPGITGGPVRSEQGYYLRPGYRLVLKYGNGGLVKATYTGDGKTVIKQLAPDTDTKGEIGFGFPAIGPSQ